MSRFIDFVISAASFGCILAILNTAGITFINWQYWAFCLVVLLFGIYQYLDGMKGWSRRGG